MVTNRRKRDDLMSKESKAIEYAVIHLSHTKQLSNEEIAKELSIKISRVNEILALSPPQKKKSSTLAKDSMINTTSVKKNKSVSIMTEGASMAYDEFTKKLNTKPPRTSKDSIFRPND